MWTTQNKKKNQYASTPHPTIKKLLLYILLTLAIALPYFGIWLCKEWYDAKVKAIDHASIILINKEDMTLKLIDYKGKTLLSYGIACGKGTAIKHSEVTTRLPKAFSISQTYKMPPAGSMISVTEKER